MRVRLLVNFLKRLSATGELYLENEYVGGKRVMAKVNMCLQWKQEGKGAARRRSSANPWAINCCSIFLPARTPTLYPIDLCSPLFPLPSVVLSSIYISPDTTATDLYSRPHFRFLSYRSYYTPLHVLSDYDK